MSFSSDAQRYFDAGYSPIPLPSGQKHPPPTGFTGGNGKRTTADQIAVWTNLPKYRDGNIACWFGEPVTVDGTVYQLVGIDVDHYGEKHGGDQLKVLEAQLGSMSNRAPWISSSRTDGHSGIRWFLAPAVDADGNRIEFRDKCDSAIDVIQRKHRYAVVWPSVIANRRYWWFPPGARLTADGRKLWRETDDLPVIADFPILSNEWVTYLREHRSHSGEIDLTISVSDLEKWAEDTFNAGDVGSMCWNISSALATFTRKITDEESSHDKITDAHWMLYSLAAEGHAGWKHAVTELENHWTTNVGVAGKRALSEAHSEVFRSRTGALRKVKIRVDRDGVGQCDCAGVGANLWHSEKIPLGVAKQFALIHEREETPVNRWRDDWYQYDGQRWKRLDRDGFNKLLYDRLDDATCLKAVKASGITTYETIPWNPTEPKIKQVEHALRAVAFLDSDAIEAPCWLDGRTDRVIAFRNTLLRIVDRKQIDHTPAFFNTNVLPFDYEPLAEEPKRWKQFLAELWPDDPESIALLQEWFGYVVSGQTNMHKMLTLIGPRRSGKTTIAHILRTLVGSDNETECRSSDIVTQFGMANLIGRTLGIFDDDRITGNGKQFVDILKNIIGEGKATVGRKYQTDWRGRLGIRFMYVANELSSMPDSSGAIIERMLVLETRNNFESKPDRKLRQALEAELPGIFNWALDGFDRLRANGEFTVPQSSQQLVAELHESASPITRFVDETCTWDENGFISDQTLFTHWQSWCNINGTVAGSKNSFMAKMRAALGNKVSHSKRGGRGDQRRGYIGLTLRYQLDGNVIPMTRNRQAESGG